MRRVDSYDACTYSRPGHWVELARIARRALIVAENEVMPVRYADWREVAAARVRRHGGRTAINNQITVRTINRLAANADDALNEDAAATVEAAMAATIQYDDVPPRRRAP